MASVLDRKESNTRRRLTNGGENAGVGMELLMALNSLLAAEEMTVRN